MCKPGRGLRASHTLGLLFALAQELDAGLWAQDVERGDAQAIRMPSGHECLLCKAHFSEVAFCLAGIFLRKAICPLGLEIYFLQDMVVV